MTNPTSNFGWQMPTSTDLVTDLPADFEVFGQAVDTDFVDLLGGTTGQVLSKTSATDLDFTWINNDTGDITGVTAGTGISGGGTSGTVTVTNSMATEITAKGDLIVGTGNATFDNLPVGTNAQILVADSTASTGLAYKGVGVANGLTTTGDTIYSSSGTTQSRLGIGSTGQVLTVASGIPSWATPAAGGVTLVTSGTFTSVTSFSVNSAFTSTYKNYSMFVNLSANTTQSTVKFRYRLSGTDNTSNNYYGGQFGYNTGGTLYTGFANPDTSVPLKDVHSIGAGWGTTGIEFTFFDPSNTTANNAHPFTADSFDPSSLNNRWVGGGQLFVSSAAYDGFSFLFSNACTGFYRIYGWG
jgi:hypothetical protein